MSRIHRERWLFTRFDCLWSSWERVERPRFFDEMLKVLKENRKRKRYLKKLKREDRMTPGLIGFFCFPDLHSSVNRYVRGFHVLWKSGWHFGLIFLLIGWRDNLNQLDKWGGNQYSIDWHLYFVNLTNQIIFSILFNFPYIFKD